MRRLAARSILVVNPLQWTSDLISKNFSAKTMCLLTTKKPVKLKIVMDLLAAKVSNRDLKFDYS